MNSNRGGGLSEKRIEAVTTTLNSLKNRPQHWLDIRDKAYRENKWFIPYYIDRALDGLVSMGENEEKLRSWLGAYNLPARKSKTIGIISAGNIPMVGFHDLLCGYFSGHRLAVKLSEKDRHLLPYMVERFSEIDPDIKEQVHFVDKLKDFDAVIATGSNNTARYFEAYFGKYPHIIRKNRNSIAILTGKESDEDLKALGEDIFAYFGLGCRNVSKLYVPSNYDFTGLMEILDEFRWHADHDKYKNNFDYNLTIYLLNKIPHLANHCMVMLEDESLISRIACLHFEKYDDLNDLTKQLKTREEQIQCIVGDPDKTGISGVPFGKSQQPAIDDYADKVDTMEFLAAQ